jgi:hypothetical protein
MAHRVGMHKAIGNPEFSCGPDDCFSGVRCPCCDDFYVSVNGDPSTVDGHDSYRAAWGGRGSLLVVPFIGECGSEFDICFGVHKGNTMAFVRVRVDCRLVAADTPAPRPGG